MNHVQGSLWPPLIEQAFRDAAAAHTGQTRKSSPLPYLYHPASVALILARAGFVDEATLAAAVLHDVVEDTAVTQQELAEKYPAKVLEFIEALSEHKSDASGEKIAWAQRKAEHVERLRSAAIEARAIALADQLHNLSTMLHDAGVDGFWDRFNASREQILRYHQRRGEACRCDDPRITKLVSSVEKVLAQLESAE